MNSRGFDSLTIDEYPKTFHPWILSYETLPEGSLLTKPMAKKPLRAPERTELIRQAIQSVLETKEGRDGGTSIEVARLYCTFPAKAHRSSLLAY